MTLLAKTVCVIAHRASITVRGFSTTLLRCAEAVLISILGAGCIEMTGVILRGLRLSYMARIVPALTRSAV